MIKFIAYFWLIIALSILGIVGGVYYLSKVIVFILKSLFEDLLSAQGAKNIVDNVFHGLLLVLILHYSGVANINLKDFDLVMFIALTLLIKPIYKLIIKI